MKKWILILAIFMTAAASFGSLTFAQEDMPEMGEGSQAGQGMKGDHGKGKHGMMGMMNKDSVVATSDGGVVILQGPRLIKYDQSLTLVKEVELPRGKKPGSQGAPAEPENSESEPAEPVF